jgi:hypothetical protein
MKFSYCTQANTSLANGEPYLIECKFVMPKEWRALEDYVHRNR